MLLAIINGPNLNLLGKREPDIYGDRPFELFLGQVRQDYPEIDIVYFQSNVEGELINYIHEIGFSADGIIINAGGYTHTSVAIADALKAVAAPYIEVHISNIFAREEYRHVSLLSAGAEGIITGLGMDSYRLAITYFSQPGR